MTDADVPCEGEGFGCAFDSDGADAGAIVNVFDLDEFGFWAAVSLVETDGRLVVRCAQSSAVEFVAQRGCERGVGFGGLPPIYSPTFDTEIW